MNFLYSFDILGHDIKFTYNQCPKFKTCIGSFISLILLSFTIISVYFFGKELVLK